MTRISYGFYNNSVWCITLRNIKLNIVFKIDTCKLGSQVIAVVETITLQSLKLYN